MSNRLILIPLGGLGERFKNVGYTIPKPLINVFGKPILYWVLDNLKISSETILIPYNNSLEKYNFENKLTHDYPNINFFFHKLDNNTRGCAESICIILNKLSVDDCPIICIDGDNFYNTDILSLWRNNNSVFTFEDNTNSTQYSYISFNKSTNVIDNIKEKEKISTYACCGSYGFNSYKKLLEFCKYIITNDIRQKEEFYLSGVINEMIKNNNLFFNITISKKDYICLGTPLQMKLFINNNPVNNVNNKKQIDIKRFCFDLDGTLVSHPTIKNDYTSVKPIIKTIEYLKYLKGMGNYIIIYTARRMKTHNGNVGAIIKDVGKITLDTLEKFKIPYDEIIFGKPYANFYIDDLGVNCFDDIDKHTGFYNSKIPPRNFNSLETRNVEIYRKKSNDLSGEIFYYLNIPSKVKDIFPVFFDYDSNNKWYEIEKINGVTISEIYTSMNLSINDFDAVLNTLHRLHSCGSVIDDDIDIYSNYTDKIVDRYNKYDYSKYENAESIYNSLIDNLSKYILSNSGTKTIIHGDSVFTNILINNLGKIKFIDMRGKVGDKLSIVGDKYYDYAKILQSLVGYDEIMHNTTVLLSYKEKFVKHFFSKFDHVEIHNIKIITKSLLFTLIPFHDDDLKKHKYISLIDSPYLN